ncbi:RICIN domain-containing protein [Actinacidiphila acidipaludis]|uniref:RICIN domain-containing protein n=1 Tax=Actinacidiphila acidipaludis TaxID=2873382 RepID=A0ABS7Q2D9_9ACTN|nr:RICIN domain-containing protein [Streptomyces acidipaludis]MBY8877288.1 RICIN domain-containing protein [Streptomyces acidipaludis]
MGLLASIGLFASTATASASTGSPMTVQNGNSGLCMSIPGDNIYAGQVIDQWSCGGYPDQYWHEESSDSHPGWFYLQPATNTDLCATYVPGSTAQLTLRNCGSYAANGNPNTELFTWWYGSRSDSLSTIQGWAMSVPGASTAAGAAINIYPYGPYPDQTWYGYDT